jgi:TetR/AcrR family transcriptional regulator, mexCD-oprJ operon repressor
MLDALATALNARPGATMTELAAAAGLSRATLHRRFPSRDDLLIRLAEDAADKTTAALADARLDTAPAREACLRLVDALVPLGGRFAFLLREGAWLDEQPAVAKGIRTVEDAVHQVIERGRRSGELRADLPESYQVRLVLAAVYTAWEAIQAGELGSREAPRAAAAALLTGIAT